MSSSLDCGHDVSNRDTALESGTVFCRLCDLESRCRDAEGREKELHEQVKTLHAGRIGAMTPTPKMPLPWIRNPDYDLDTLIPMLVGDRFLTAVPLHQNSGGGYDISVITADETGFNDANGESWGAWCWADVEWYIPLDGARKLEDMPDE